MNVEDTIDDNFNYFLKKFGHPFGSRPVSDEVVCRYRDRLPEQLVTYWRTFGACGFSSGLFWITNPKDYQAILDRWIAGTIFETRPGLSVIARTAFGELHVWEKGKGRVLLIDPLSSALMLHSHIDRNELGDTEENQKMQYFWAFQKREDVDYRDASERPMFDLAFNRLGPVGATEMYGYAHSPALGGCESAENLDIMKIEVYHDVARQMSPPEIVII